MCRSLRRQSIARLFSLGIFNVDKVDLHLLCSLDTDDQRRTLSGSNDLGWVVDRLQKKTKGTLELLDHRLSKRGKIDVWVRIVEEFGELRNAFGVGVGLKLEPLALKERLELFVVGDDTIVDDSELPLGIGSGTISLFSRC